jgi:hypothetical protein
VPDTIEQHGEMIRRLGREVVGLERTVGRRRRPDATHQPVRAVHGAILALAVQQHGPEFELSLEGCRLFVTPRDVKRDWRDRLPPEEVDLHRARMAYRRPVQRKWDRFGPLESLSPTPNRDVWPTKALFAALDAPAGPSDSPVRPRRARDEAYCAGTGRLVMEYLELRADARFSDALEDGFVAWLHSPGERRRYEQGDDMERAALVDWFLRVVR